jgi:hypothetical protein
MKIPNKQLIRLWLFVPILLTVLVWSSGCADVSHHQKLLTGWSHDFSPQLDKAIVNDYEAFIQGLPPKERMLVHKYNIEPLINNKGEHAIRFEIGIDGIFDGTWWDYMLIYNKDNKRIKVIKYANGKYSL